MSIKLSFLFYPLLKIIHSIVIKISVNLETPSIPKQKNKGGRPLGTIWEDINQGQVITLGKFATSCKYCEVT